MNLKHNILALVSKANKLPSLIDKHKILLLHYWLFVKMALEFYDSPNKTL